MTIEPPLVLNRPTVGTSESMCPEGVAYPTPYILQEQCQQQSTNLQRNCNNNIVLPPSSNYLQGIGRSPDTPEQYAPDFLSVSVSSPTSTLMYEQDVSDMQKSLLSPCSTQTSCLTESFGSQTSIAALSQGIPECMDDCRPNMDDLEISLNLEGMVSNMPESRLPIKLEPPWSPPVVLDTGQDLKFKVEDVMMSRNVNQGPTLAQLNDMDEMDSSIFDDITSIIYNDPINMLNKIDQQQQPLPSSAYDQHSNSSMGKKLPSLTEQMKGLVSRIHTGSSKNSPLSVNIPPLCLDNGNKDSNLMTKKNKGQDESMVVQQNKSVVSLPKNVALSPTTAYPNMENLLRATPTRLSSASTNIPRFTTCTITSPVQEVPTVVTATTIVKSEPPNSAIIYAPCTQQPLFNIVNIPNTSAFVSGNIVKSPIIGGFRPNNSNNSQFIFPAMSTLDESSLQKLLAPPAPTAVVKPEISADVENSITIAESKLHRKSIKAHRKISEGSTTSEPVALPILPSTIPMQNISPLNSQQPRSHDVVLSLQNSSLDSTNMTSISQNTAHKTLHSTLRSDSKSSDSDESCGSKSGSNSSFSRKWEEIKHYLEAESASNTGNKLGKKIQVSEEPTAKKIKLEQSDVAYNPVDEIASPQDFHSDSDSDLDADISDTESVTSHSSFVEELLVGGKKEKRYFWQYNTQAKGPKGKRLCKTVETNDPHILNNFEDPVFDPDITDAKYKHNGRARKGDGNDITPSPYKLFQIGNQLKKLNRKIHEIAPAGEITMPTRNKTRREKNKYASRACRLKKKAQHEANKIKLYGLDTEHAQLMTVLECIRDEIFNKVNHGINTNDSVTIKLEKLMKTHLTVMVAGNTADYVNSVLEHVVSGDKTGGLKLC